MVDSYIYVKPYIVNNQRVEVLVRENEVTKLLFFEANQATWDEPLLNDDFAMVALSQYCSFRRKDLFVDGTITKSSLIHIEEFIQIWSIWRPNLFSRIRIDAANIINDIPNRDLPAVLAFSGGVDASFSLAIHTSKQLGWLSKDIGLGVMIIGYDLKENDPEAVLNAFNSIKSTLNEHYGIPAVAIKTNWQQEFCPNWILGFNVGVTAILHLFSSRYSSGIFSSDFNYLQELDLEPYGSHLTVNHLLGTFTFPIITTGGTHTRLQKVKFLKGFPNLINNLRVCWQRNSNGRNCGECEKCDRTRMELIESGIDIDIFDTPYNEERLKNITIPKRLALMFYEDIFTSSNENSIIHEITKVILDREKRKFDQLDELNRQLSLKDEQISKQKELLKEVTGELNACLNSKSWKITRPLRWISSKKKMFCQSFIDFFMIILY